MSKITNAVLAEKIDNLHTTLKTDIKPAVKANTEFRLQAKGIMATVGIVASFLGGVIVWSADKVYTLIGGK